MSDRYDALRKFAATEYADVIITEDLLEDLRALLTAHDDAPAVVERETVRAKTYACSLSLAMRAAIDWMAIGWELHTDDQKVWLAAQDLRVREVHTSTVKALRERAIIGRAYSINGITVWRLRPAVLEQCTPACPRVITLEAA